VAAHYSGLAAYGLFGLAVRPSRLVEAGAGLGLGLANNTVNLGVGGDDAFSWRGAARGQISVAAIGLPAGLELTGALTLDRVFGSAYNDGETQFYPYLAFPTVTSLQLGALLIAGRRL
jgi:hypothetical protein